MQSLQGDGMRAAGQPERPRHLGDGADAGVLAFVHRYEEHPLLVTVSIASVTDMFGKTTLSSSGISNSSDTFSAP